jgi:hypothetical protein
VTRLAGSLRRIEMGAADIEPGSFNLPIGVGEEGAPIEASIGNEQEATLVAPSTGSLESPQLKVIGRAGETATLRTVLGVGFFETDEEGQLEATGKGLIVELSGYSSKGEKAIGPVELACIEPATELASWTIEAVAPPPSAIPSTYNLPATGAIEDSTLSQSIPLPEGTTFTGSAAYPETVSFPGSFSGEVHVPAFSGSLKLLGLIPITFGLQIENVKPFTGIPVLTSGGEWSLSASGAYSISIDSVSLLSLKIPTSCHSEQPLASSTLLTSTEAQARAGTLSASFPAALTRFECEGGLLGKPFGPVLTYLLSGTLQVSVT